MIVAITGHQDLGASRDWVRTTLAEQIRLHDVALGLTNLAIGTDQLFAEVLLELTIPYDAIIPSANYEDTFKTPADRRRFDDLLANAARVERLPYDEPTGEAFFEAGRVLVSRCALLFAVWNGQPARGLGGTGDVVSYARSMARRWLHINPADRSVSL